MSADRRNELERQFAQLMAAHPGGIRGTNIPRLFHERFGATLDVRAYGCRKLGQLLRQLPTLRIVHNFPTHDLMVHARETKEETATADAAAKALPR